ncbi:MAG: hypothetical protein LBU98_02105 [Alistipes sp.]|jgi:hypothetical protein|nr:hypothetical protein [Alistipes sp.]
MTPETGNSVTFDTARVILVPEDEYQGAEVGRACLRFSGIEPGAGEEVVVSQPENGIVAVMAVPAREWAQYEEGYKGGEVAVTSPLLAVATGGGGRGRKREVNIVLTPENVYLAVWEKGLRMAEALPDNSVDSILYYMQVAGRRFRLHKFDINVSGSRAGLVAETLRQYYKKVRIAE